MYKYGIVKEKIRQKLAWEKSVVYFCPQQRELRGHSVTDTNEGPPENYLLIRNT